MQKCNQLSLIIIAIVSQKQNNVPGPENTNPIIHFQITWMLEPT